MRGKAPDGEFSDVQLYILRERKQQICQSFVLKCMDFIELCSFQKDAFLGEDLVDAIHPFGEVTTTALENQSLGTAHLTKLIGSNDVNFAQYLPPPSFQNRPP